MWGGGGYVLRRTGEREERLIILIFADFPADV